MSSQQEELSSPTRRKLFRRAEQGAAFDRSPANNRGVVLLEPRKMVSKPWCFRKLVYHFYI
jgi:hypothetical protein